MNKRFESLDAFRGLCAIFVVIFHLNLIGSITELAFFKGSNIFVEFFFVLSGFVLAHGYGFKEKLNFKSFMKARFFRLYPLHLFMFFVLVILEFVKLFAFKFGGFVFNNEPFTYLFDVREIIPNLLLIQSWTPYTEHLSFNAPSWSISIEFYVYAILFITIVLFKSRKTVSWFLISFLALILILLNSDILVDPVLRGLSCFFGGAFTYVIYKKVSHLQLPYIFGSLIEILLLLGVVITVQSSFEHRSIITSVLFFVTVLFFAFEAGALSNLLKKKPFQHLGKLSYSIYMTHSAILFCLTSTAIILQKITHIEMAPMVGNRRYLNFGDEFINNVIIIIILSIVILVSSLTYKYIELYGQKLNDKEGHKKGIN